MILLLLAAGMVSGLVYAAGFKLARTWRIVAALTCFAVLGVLPFALAWLNPALVGCWAYREQCAAKRISGLSAEQCRAREDAIAYLWEGGICLVSPND